MSSSSLLVYAMKSYRFTRLINNDFYLKMPEINENFGII